MKKVTAGLAVVALLLAISGPPALANPAAKAAKTEVKQLLKASLIQGAMQADLMEAVEEAMGYLLLNDPEEKADFARKMKDFEVLAIKFKMAMDLSKPKYKRIYNEFEKVLAAKSQMQVAAEVLFKDLEAKKPLNVKKFQDFEQSVDQLTTLYDKFLDKLITEDVKERLASSPEARAAMLLAAMQADILEAVEESKAYVLLNQKAEKMDFFRKMQDFDNGAFRFKYKQKIGWVGREEISTAFYNMTAAKENLEGAAILMFLDFEKHKKVSSAKAIGYEKAIDAFTQAFDRLAVEFMKSYFLD